MYLVCVALRDINQEQVHKFMSFTFVCSRRVSSTLPDLGQGRHVEIANLQFSDRVSGSNCASCGKGFPAGA